MINKIRNLTIMLLFSTCHILASEETNISIPEMTTDAGQNIAVPITLNGMADAFQFRIYLPDGITSTGIKRGIIINDSTYSFGSSERKDNSFFALCYSPKSMPITGSGSIAEITLNISENIEPGDYYLKFKEIECALKGVQTSQSSEKIVKITITDPTAIERIPTTKSQIEKISVYNIAGQLIKEETATTKDNVSDCISNLESGIYIIKSNGTTKKVIKKIRGH